MPISLGHAVIVVHVRFRRGCSDERRNIIQNLRIHIVQYFLCIIRYTGHYNSKAHTDLNLCLLRRQKVFICAISQVDGRWTFVAIEKRNKDTLASSVIHFVDFATLFWPVIPRYWLLGRVINIHALGAVSFGRGHRIRTDSTWLFKPSDVESGSGSNESIASSGRR